MLLTEVALLLAMRIKILLNVMVYQGYFCILFTSKLDFNSKESTQHTDQMVA